MVKKHSLKMLIMCVLLYLPVQTITINAVSASNEQGAVIVDESLDKVILDNFIEVLVDPSYKLTVEDVASGQYDHLFHPYAGKGRPNYGYDASAYWVRVKLDNQMLNPKTWLLEIGSPKLNEVILYTKNNNSDTFTEQTIRNDIPFSERRIQHRFFVMPLLFANSGEQTIYLRFSTGSSVQIPLTLWDEVDFFEQSQNEYILLGMLFGLSIVMAIYNLFLFFSIRESSYLYYVFFVLLNTLLYLTDTGLSDQYLWPNMVVTPLVSVTALMYISSVSGLLFVRSFLSITNERKGLNRLFIILIMLNVLGFVIRQLTFTGAVYGAAISVFLTILLIIYATTLSFWRGYRPAKYLLMAWGAFLLGVFISLMVDIGAMPLTFITKYAWQITTSLEVILLSFALGDKYKVFREEKELAVRKANIAQQEALENLKRTDKLKDEFLAITSHELQTPLNGIIGIAETMRDGAVGEINEQEHHHLEMIMKSGKRLSHLIQDILDYSSLKHGHLKMDYQPVHLYETANLVIALCQTLIKDKRVQLINNIKPNEKLIVYADERRLQQIFYNLIGNAIKFTTAGEVVIDATIIQDEVQINVSDTGSGISSKEQAVIFDQFYQIEDGETREYGGSGIGLNITKILVEKHGSDLQVSSVVGEGSTFYFKLPIYQGKINEKKSGEMKLKRVEQMVHTHVSIPEKLEGKPESAKILIVDDDPINLQVLLNQLNLAGYDVITASSGKEVLEIVQIEQIDLLILDIMMPKMSGYEVCEHLRKQFSLIQLPILMLTAKSQIQDKIHAFTFGANDYLSKPCDRRELLTRVNTLIQLRQLNMELIRMNASLEDKVQIRTKELQVANENMKHMAKSRQLLLANIAHDLGAPITVIYNYIQALDKGLIVAEEHDHYLQLVYSKIHILNRLISDLFDLSKLESEQLELNIYERNVKEWVDGLRFKYNLEMKYTNRQFSSKSTDIAPDLYCFIDEQRMEQVFSNIIRNAVNHTKSGDGEVIVSSKVNEAQDEITFMIADNGTGISKENIPYIFDRYYKTNASEEGHQGIGIGLAIVKGMVEAHQGHVWVESERHVGSCFYITLPVFQKKARNIHKEVIESGDFA